MLKNRFADTILRAREKTLNEVGFCCYTHPVIPVHFLVIFHSLCDPMYFDLAEIRLIRGILRNCVVRGRNLNCSGEKVKSNPLLPSPSSPIFWFYFCALYIPVFWAYEENKILVYVYAFGCAILK